MSHTHPESYSGPLSSGPRLSRRLSRKEGRRTSAPAWLVAASRRAQESVARVARMSPVSCPAGEQLRSVRTNRRTHQHQGKQRASSSSAMFVSIQPS